MAPRRPSEAKKDALQRHGTLHGRPEDVTDELFLEHDFFDARDMLQVKYEMLRRVRIDRLPIAQVARMYGLSRPAFYKARKAFERDGIWGLLPAKRGPRRAHKLSEEVMAFAAKKQKQDPALKGLALLRLIQKKFHLSVHPRSLERALQRAEKKTP